MTYYTSHWNVFKSLLIWCWSWEILSIHKHFFKIRSIFADSWMIFCLVWYFVVKTSYFQLKQLKGFNCEIESQICFPNLIFKQQVLYLSHSNESIMIINYQYQEFLIIQLTPWKSNHDHNKLLENEFICTKVKIDTFTYATSGGSLSHTLIITPH